MKSRYLSFEKVMLCHQVTWFVTEFVTGIFVSQKKRRWAMVKACALEWCATYLETHKVGA
jgi:hypothetical protein